MSTDADTATERVLAALEPNTTIYVVHGARNGAKQTFHLQTSCHALSGDTRVKSREYQHRPLRATCCSYCVHAAVETSDDARTAVGEDAAGMPDYGRCSHPEDGMVYACAECDEPNPYKRSDKHVAEGAARFRCSTCEATADRIVKRESHSHTRGTGGVSDRDDDLVPDGGQPAGTECCWDNAECPRDDCEGDLQQQDTFNVTCLSCRGVWSHVKTEAKHYLQTAGGETVAQKPITVTDGGQPAGDAEQTPCEGCDKPIRFDQARPYYKTADERFWHPDCLPEDYRPVDADADRDDDLVPGGGTHCEWCGAPLPEAGTVVENIYRPDGSHYETRTICNPCNCYGPPHDPRREQIEAAWTLATNMSPLERVGWKLIWRARR